MILRLHFDPKTMEPLDQAEASETINKSSPLLNGFLLGTGHRDNKSNTGGL